MSQNKMIKTGPIPREEAHPQREIERQTKNKLPGKERSRHSGREQAIGKEKEQKDQARPTINKLLSDIKQMSNHRKEK